jgi:hypothetical protein
MRPPKDQTYRNLQSLPLCNRPASEKWSAIDFRRRTGRSPLWVKNGSRGGTDTSPTDHLPLTDQIAVCWGGTAAEDVFKCVSHEYAAFGDHTRVMELLEAHEITEDNGGPALRDQGYSIATTTLEANKTRVLELAERLVEVGRVDAAEFLRLMNSTA